MARGTDDTRLADGNWVVVLAMAQAEWQVFTALLAHGAEAMLPYVLGSARRGRWQHGVVRPLYPGYLFAQLGNTEAVRRVHGVRDLLRLDAGRLVLLPTAEIDSLRRQWLESYREALPRRLRPPAPRPGAWIKIPRGPFTGAPAMITAIDKSGQISATLGPLQVSFHLDDLRDTAVRGGAKPATNTNIANA